MKITLMPSDNGDFLRISDGAGHLLYGVRQQLFSSEKYRKAGCGTAAAANIMLWLSAADSEHQTVTPEVWKDLAEKINRFMPADADGLRLMYAFRKFSGRKISYYPIILTKKEKLLEIVNRSLENDCPLILAVFSPGKGFPVYLCGKDFQPLEKGTENITGHYMTVTGTVVSQRRFIVVSSWGKKYLADLDMMYSRNLPNPIYGIGTGVFAISEKQ